MSNPVFAGVLDEWHVLDGVCLGHLLSRLLAQVVGGIHNAQSRSILV